ncbi:MAG: DEAD/DEAH box helicase [DPANN group archaeon]|nr:DEAD/DEAH box helicase [DPANN group archaeon]
MNKFKELGLQAELTKAIEDQGFEQPTEIQEKTIPLTLQGKDIIAGSATGSGKTLAFGAGIIQNSENKQHAQALILSPTRELTEQIKKELDKFSKYKKLNIALVFGGVPIGNQIKELKTADIVVGTPGRVLDHISRRTIDLSKVKTVVLDEGDRMLDMGFIDDVERIINNCPVDRQTMLFSATIPSDLARLSRKYMKNPVSISLEQYVDPKKLTQYYYQVPDKLKFSTLVHLLKNEHSGLVMVFCNTRRNTDFVANNLKKLGIEAQAIHGGFAQNKRTRTMEKFHSQKTEVLVCTDVAARGLHITGVTHVYNYDTPKDEKMYIHRIGRTARAGKEGAAINIIGNSDQDSFRNVWSEHGDVLVEKQMPRIEQVTIQWRERPSLHGGPRGPMRPRSGQGGAGRMPGGMRHRAPRPSQGIHRPSQGANRNRRRF